MCNDTIKKFVNVNKKFKKRNVSIDIISNQNLTYLNH